MTTESRAKCLVEAVKRHIGFPVEFLNVAKNCMDVATGKLAISCRYKGVAALCGTTWHPAISACEISDSLQISRMLIITVQPSHLIS